MLRVKADTGSFRDPSGRVYVGENRVFRTVMPVASPMYHAVRKTDALKPLIEDGLVIEELVIDTDVLGPNGLGADIVLEHPKLPFVSYPYEWSFSGLKAAALLHLDIHLRVLDHGVTLSDSSAYNVQFLGPRPIFIDSLSFRSYRDGEFWTGHRQFCEQFLNPLLLRSTVGIAHNAWYRGNLEGISPEELSRVLPFHRQFSINMFTHVVMQAILQKRSNARSKASKTVEKKLPLVAFKRMLISLRNWIDKLTPPNREDTVWSDYADDNSYSSDESVKKGHVISEFTKSVKPSMVWDIGCNTGDFSKIALDSGAEYAIGFDFDQGALDKAFSRACDQNLNLLPLFLDAANPAPNQGWDGRERISLMDRAPADAIFALAVVHHLAITRNIPLPRVIDWIVDMAPAGIIEFVPKTDPMVQELLRLRDDIFENYSEEIFTTHLEKRAKIVHVETVSEANRKLFWFTRS